MAFFLSDGVLNKCYHAMGGEFFGVRLDCEQSLFCSKIRREERKQVACECYCKRGMRVAKPRAQKEKRYGKGTIIVIVDLHSLLLKSPGSSRTTEPQGKTQKRLDKRSFKIF